MAFCMSLGSCLLLGRKTIVDHFRLKWVQACGEGESGAFLLKMFHGMRLTPPPHVENGKTLNLNKHNTLCPFEDHSLCTLIGYINTLYW